MSEAKIEFELVTDTATLFIFDPAALRHRLNDDADWWSIERDALEEVRHGNVAFVDLGSDGKYQVEIDDSTAGENTVSCNLRCPSGRIFIGAGEEVTGDGLEPEGIRGGGFLHREPGTYRVSISRRGAFALAVQIKTGSSAANDAQEPMRV